MFRFGMGLRDTSSAAKVRDAARRAEDLGYDVILVPDHLGAPAPFPVLATVAAVTETLTLGTFVLNAGFYKPALLARDVAALHELSGGRFEVGLGAGYVREEFDAAGAAVPAGPPAHRVSGTPHAIPGRARPGRSDHDRRRR